MEKNELEINSSSASKDGLTIRGPHFTSYGILEKTKIRCVPVFSVEGILENVRDITRIESHLRTMKEEKARIEEMGQTNETLSELSLSAEERNDASRRYALIRRGLLEKYGGGALTETDTFYLSEVVKAIKSLERDYPLRRETC